MRVCVQNICSIAVLLVLFGFTSLALGKDEFRSWGDAKGKNKIKAKFVKLEGDTVTLEKEDGEEVEIELKKLSAADQKFATDAAKESDDSPFKKKSDSPFKAKPKGDKKTPEMADETGDSGEFRMIKVNYKTAKQLKMSAPGKSWKIDVTPSEFRITNELPDAIHLPRKTDFFEKLNGLVVSRGANSRTAVVSFTLEKQGNATTRIILCDLNTGEAGTLASTSGQYVPLAVHEDGRRILMRSTAFGWGKNDQLEIWTLKDDEVTKLIGWMPYDFEKGGARDVIWAKFLDDDRLATCSGQGKVFLWSFPDIKLIAGFDTSHGAIPALSPDRKMLAYSNGTAIGILDTTKQKVLAQQDAFPKPTVTNLAFSPSGTRLAGATNDKVFVWNVANGKVEHTIPCDGIHLAGRIDFVDENFVLVGNHYLLDVEKELKLWTYNGGEQAEALDGMAFFALSNGTDHEGALVPVQLLHSGAKELLKKAMDEPNEFALAPGTAVRIDVSAIDASQRERVMKGLAKQLGAIECKGGTTGTVDLVVSVEGPKDRELSYRGFGDYKFKEYRTSMKIVLQGKQIWQSVGVNTPGIVQLKAGETMESHLKSREVPSYEFFENSPLPRFLEKSGRLQSAPSALTMGTSDVTTVGIR